MVLQVIQLRVTCIAQGAERASAQGRASPLEWAALLAVMSEGHAPVCPTMGGGASYYQGPPSLYELDRPLWPLLRLPAVRSGIVYAALR
jgi:hypothetical protein